MNRPDPRRLASAKHHRDAIAELIKRLDTKTLEDLLRRATYSPNVDGYGSNSGSEVRPTGISNPTMAAIERLAGGRLETEESEPGKGDGRPATPDTWTQNEADPVGKALVEFFGLLSEMGGLAVAADRKAQYILAAADAVSARRWDAAEARDVCVVCDRPVAGTESDRLRAVGEGKACDADRMAWERAGRPMAGPDFTAWKAERRAFLAGRSAEPATPGSPPDSTGATDSAA